MTRTFRGRFEERGSALWGSGTRGEGHRSNALWGRGGRGLAGLAVLLTALLVPITAVGAPAKRGDPPKSGAYVADSLLRKAKARPNETIRVIIQSTRGAGDAQTKFKGLGSLKRRLGIVGAIAVELPANKLEKLAGNPDLIITPDAPVKTSGKKSSGQVWPYESGNAKNWYSDDRYAAGMPAIAIVDSGIDADREDFAGRIVADVNLSSLANNSPGDGRGHGTFVAGVAAGAAVGFAGAAPAAKLVSIDVMDDTGMARTSDVIAAAEWILANKNAYNIRVANFSLHSATPSNFTHDPLDRAVERLWFSGVVVVAAAGNYGTPDGPSGVKYAPGNDPFVITVGAVDIGGTTRIWDDQAAPFSAYGYTYDGFRKPEVSAVGRYMVASVSKSGSLKAAKPANVVSDGYMQLSGTSFSAPVVSGTVAQMLARHPDWTPDQVKGALMATAKRVPKGVAEAAGVGQINAWRAANFYGTPPNPNAGLNRFVIADPNGGVVPVFDAVSWTDVSWSDVSWDSVSWTDVSWSDVSWDSVSWSDVSWDSVSWTDVSWSDVSWSDVSWTDVSWEDAAEGDANADGGSPVNVTEAVEIAADPDIAVPVEDILAPVDPPAAG